MLNSFVFKPQQKQRGQVLIIIALAFIGIIGIVGLVVDGGNVFSDRRGAQNAADAAALSTAYARIRGEQDWVGAALASAAENGYNNDGIKNTVAVYSPPSDGPHAGDVEYIQIIITSHVDTYFTRLIGRQQITNIATATARNKVPEVRQLLNGLAVVSLAPTSNCANNKAFWVHGEATLDITGGGVFVNSNNDTCAFMQQGNGSVRINDEHSIDVVGNASIQKLQLLTPAVTVGVSPINYPPPFFMPKPGCGKAAEVSVDGSTMSSGNWDEEFPPAGVTHLQSGVYCLNDGFNVSGSLEGHNVVFKVEHGEVRFNGGATIILDAPNGGNNAGLLIYLPMENKSRVVLNGEAGSNLKGTILAPASPILIKGFDSPLGIHSQIISLHSGADDMTMNAKGRIESFDE